MKKLFAGLIMVLNIVSTSAFAVIIDQDGISYSCKPVGGSSHHNCASKCVTYCAKYDNYPFADRCLKKASGCGPSANVQTICSTYDTYPFQDKCLQQEDVVVTDINCN